uniref:Uncharacterized protein n=1 Tax=Noccaea caerulescens TaxID=107243 RepID=A0A1J3H0T6_NOCCA
MSQDVDIMKELQLFEHLEVVTVDIGSILVADRLLNTPTATRVANTGLMRLNGRTKSLKSVSYLLHNRFPKSVSVTVIWFYCSGWCVLFQ